MKKKAAESRDFFTPSPGLDTGKAPQPKPIYGQMISQRLAEAIRIRTAAWIEAGRPHIS